MAKDNDRYQKMIESSQDWFWEFDENANFTYASPSIKDLLGYAPEEVIGLNAFDLMSSKEAERVREHFDPIAKRYQPFSGLININRHKDGHEVIIESSGTPVFGGAGEFLGYRGIDRDVTQRIKKSDELQQSKERLQRILDTSSDFIWEMDLTGKHTYSNQRVSSILGFDAKEIVGKNYSEDLYEEDLLKVREVLPQLIEKKQGWDGWVLRWRHADGSLRYLESSARPILDAQGEIVGYSGSDRDITEKKLAVEALLKQQELLARTQNIAQTGSWQYEVATDELIWSDETYRIFGVDANVNVSLDDFYELVHPEDRALVEAAYTSSMSEGRKGYETEHRIIKKNTGETRHVFEKCKHEHDQNGGVVRSVGMVQDITELRTSENALLAATQATEAANKAKSLFLAKLSHEIRTPMTAIIGFGELLEDTKLTQEQKKYLAAINASTSTLYSLIDDILNFSKIDAGELTFRPSEFSLHRLVSQISETLEQKLAAKRLPLNVDIESDVPGSLIGDPVRLKQVLLNLLENAIKFTDEGQIRLTASVAESNDLRFLLNIAVEDTGIGIPEELHGYIFEPFAQAKDSTTSNYGGSGLGLSISLSLACLMGGTLRVKSQKGAGSTFNLLIPMQRSTGDQSGKAATESMEGHWSGPSLTILLAEDNQINSQFIKTALEKVGHVVTVAKNGKEALDILKRGRFDLALVDIQMPVMNGTDLLRVIRERELLTRQRLPLIAMTAYALIGDKEKYLNMGFDGYLSKPLRTKDLMETLTLIMPA